MQVCNGIFVGFTKFHCTLAYICVCVCVCVCVASYGIDEVVWVIGWFVVLG